MKLQVISTLYRFVVVAFALVVVVSCASTGNLIEDRQLTIDKAHSDNLRINYVFAQNTDEGIEIAGTVRFNRAMVGTPRDHMVVTIIDPDGKELYTARTRYVHYGRATKQSHTYKFSLVVARNIPEGSVIRLTND